MSKKRNSYQMKDFDLSKFIRTNNLSINDICEKLKVSRTCIYKTIKRKTIKIKYLSLLNELVKEDIT